MLRIVTSVLAFLIPQVQSSKDHTTKKGHCFLELMDDMGQMLVLRLDPLILGELMCQLGLVHQEELDLVEKKVQTAEGAYQREFAAHSRAVNDKSDLQYQISNLKRQVEVLMQHLPKPDVESLVEEEIVKLIQIGQKIQAIKSVRNAVGGLGLYEAKCIVDNWLVSANWAGEAGNQPHRQGMKNWSGTGQEVFQDLYNKQGMLVSESDPSVETEDGLAAENTQPPTVDANPASGLPLEEDPFKDE